MATAKQLPSGSWRVRVYDSETGKYLSFTSKLPGKAGKNEAEFLAKEWQAGKKQKKDPCPVSAETDAAHAAAEATAIHRRYRHNHSVVIFCECHIGLLSPGSYPGKRSHP